MDKSAVQTESAPAAIGPYSQAIRTGNLVFTSGQIPLHPDGTLVEGGIEVQTTQVMHNLQAVLEAAGSSLEHVVKCTCFVADLNDFGAINKVYGSFFKKTPPARSAVEVARLPLDVKIEIEAVAVLADG
ncbi:MAG: RidA family protein [Trueperaceae bacterium]|nr:MAG: RidA family protein [Trueperaceae bacterium]